jgi:hypothetical protein
VSNSQKVYSVGTTPVTVVAPTADYAKYVIKNIQPASVDEYARDGYIYALFSHRNLTAGQVENLCFTTGSTGAQLDYYQLISESSSVFSVIIENPTVTTTGSNIPVFNVNRNYSDTPNASIKVATSVTGGTIVQSEFVTASNQGGGAISSQKIVTLKPNTNYVFQATNVGNQTTSWYSQIGFSEHYNGYNRIWLATIDDSFVLNAGEELMMELLPNATINAVSRINSNKLSVMRQK